MHMPCSSITDCLCCVLQARHEVKGAKSKGKKSGSAKGKKKK
jgi:hypothetical protein